MLHSKITSWFFFSYLVLLLNFGPSLHHAPIFGLHVEQNHLSNHADESHSCCCCLSHLQRNTLIPSPATEVPADVESAPDLNDPGQGQHNCVFCKFFDEYNVVVASFDCAPIETPFSLFLSELSDGASAEFVPNVARGPPTA